MIDKEKPEKPVHGEEKQAKQIPGVDGLHETEEPALGPGYGEEELDEAKVREGWKEGRISIVAGRTIATEADLELTQSALAADEAAKKEKAKATEPTTPASHAAPAPQPAAPHTAPSAEEGKKR